MKRCSLERLVAMVWLIALPLHAAEASWRQPQCPFKIYGNTWYVGTQGLSAILITSPHGHVLIDGTLADNAPLIEANIRALGFRVSDIKVILNSHAHTDHAGAIAALARDSGAVVEASAAGAKALRLGGDDPDDPQQGLTPPFPPVTAVRVIADGAVVRVGKLAVLAHFTPGHTPGSSSWTWQSCERHRCLALAYADSLTAISRDGFRFSDDAAYPQRVEAFRHSIAVVAALPCDILVTPHPDAVDLQARVASRDHGKVPDALLEPHACERYAEAATKRLDARLADEARPGR